MLGRLGGEMIEYNYRYIAALGFVIDTLNKRIVYHYAKDSYNNCKRNMRRKISEDDIFQMLIDADAPYQSDNFKACAQIAQVTL